MNQMINKIFCYLKVLLLLACFVFSFFIIINMYQRLGKNLVDAVFNFIPYVILFLLFSINIVLKQKSVNDNMFYNITCCLVFGMLLFSVYRTFFDRNMVAFIRLGYNINLNYFADMIAPMRAMLYMLSVSNVLLILDGMNLKFQKKEVPVVEETPKNKEEQEIVLTTNEIGI